MSKIHSHIKILFCDDSSLMRDLIKKKLISDNFIFDYCNNGEELVNLVKDNKYSVIITDIEMPQKNGIDAFKDVRESGNLTPFIFYSSLVREKKAQKLMEFFDYDYVEFCQKPIGFGGEVLSIEESIEILKNKKSYFIDLNNNKKSISNRNTSTNRIDIHNPYFDLILIGSSTGGPAVLKDILSNVTASKVPPILIAQHMPPIYTNTLAASLNSRSKLTIIEACDKMEISPNMVLIAPGNHHMTLSKNSEKKYIIKLNSAPLVNSCRPSVDVLIDSVNDNFNGRVLIIMLSGMGKDGCDATVRAKQYKRAKVIIQNKESCSVWGMPAAVHEANAYDHCFSVEEITRYINNLKN